MGCKENSDYGYVSGSSSLSSLWLSRDKWPCFSSQDRLDMKQNSASHMDDVLVRGRSVDDVMREFRMNGSDAPYHPDDDNIWAMTAGETILGTSHRDGGTGGGAGAGYTRQHSWPPAAPSARRVTPAPAPAPVPAPVPDWPRGEFATSTPIFDEPLVRPRGPLERERERDQLTEEQAGALSSLPDGVLHALIEGLRATSHKHQECRFCKNNGERESYYRSHRLKTGGRVSCPVLRAFVCRQCGATGDDAHTLKYCPLATAADRQKSVAMMRSVRMSSSRRRYTLPPPAVNSEDYVLFGDTTPSVVRDKDEFQRFVAAPLNPLWAALERKLML